MKQVGLIPLLGFIVFSLASMLSFGRSVSDIEVFHCKVLASFDDMKKQGKASDREALQQLFKVAHRAVIDFAWNSEYAQLSQSNYLTQLTRDIASLKKMIKQKRKSKESIDTELHLFESLTQLKKFLKKYRLQLEVVGHHAAIRAQWGDLFELVDQSQDILPALPLKGIDQAGLKGLKVLIKRMERHLGEIEVFEDRLHADWVDLKLANYVFKIELIRLRNAAIFHPLYRGMPIQTNYPR